MMMKLRCYRTNYSGKSYITWIDFQVRSDAVRVDDRLKHVRELVSLVVGRWRLFRLHPVQNRRHTAAAALLDTEGQRSRSQPRSTFEVIEASTFTYDMH